jgi:hypothetical protein
MKKKLILISFALGMYFSLSMAQVLTLPTTQNPGPTNWVGIGNSSFTPLDYLHLRNYVNTSTYTSVGIRLQTFDSYYASNNNNHWLIKSYSPAASNDSRIEFSYGKTTSSTASPAMTTKAYLQNTGHFFASGITDINNASYYLRPSSTATALNVKGNILTEGKIGIGTINTPQNLSIYSSTNCGIQLENSTFQWVIENTFDDGNPMAGCLQIRQNGIKRLTLYRDQGAIFGSAVTYFKDVSGRDNGYLCLDFDNPHATHEMLTLLNDQNNKVFSIQQSGNMFVDGKITAKEIEVKANVWADYVFKNDYQLMTIPQLESYIIENNRLPDVPSEAEVMEKGVNVGDMNALLLKKIEEQALYIIQMNKTLEELKSKVEKLESK